MNAPTATALRPTAVPRPTVGRLRLRPTRRGRGFVVGVVDATGPDTNGFAPRDRVAWRDTTEDLGGLVLLDQDDVLGVPSWISDEQVVSYLGAGLIARTLVRTAQDDRTGELRPFGRGDDVRVASSDPLVAAMTAAWAGSLGARVVEDRCGIVIHDAARTRREDFGSRGRLAQAAVEVFQAIRGGVFDAVEPLPQSAGRIAA